MVLSYYEYKPTLIFQFLAVQCRLPKNEGFTCGNSIQTFYYFDVNTKKCTEFLYNGCGGNGNRFLTLEQCQMGCGPLGGCPIGEPLTDNAGNLLQCNTGGPMCPDHFDCVRYSEDRRMNLCCPNLGTVKMSQIIPSHRIPQMATHFCITPVKIEC